MKKCPTCQMTVNADNECPFCGTTLTYEPFCDTEKEHIVLNKYYLIYFAKNIWFSVICCLLGIIRLIAVKPMISELLIAAILCALFSFFISCFQRRLLQKKWIYREEFMEIQIRLWKYGSGLLSVIFFFFIQ